ncbi:diguanylate cyclase [Thiohalomonas denitrificans]|uniref:PAS domain S-box-containing protein/diguanylate cyclase (GGDEF) domain-containing protein n=1 Tax=Thiohalomonas denitrificans TaxID=415747 RepID=A0A1G5PJF3_9GAMM|nr:diguanylate cyclase [Thiohalomonas denitrificans]SCZ49637.1 PAS domain S-box-containing protein/diguanylate cyclase (GGDEF) domain-containing protein [Thiohalomonas denitrificans]
MSEQDLTVLVVDDDECDRIAMHRALARTSPGAEVHDVGSQRSALSLLSERPFDCAFVDYQLPDGDGLTLLRNALARGITTPIVMFTGLGGEALAVEALQGGAVDYLSKSELTTERLRRCLGRVARPGRVPAAGPPETLGHLLRAIDNAAESMMVTDSRGRIEYVNPAFTALTGYRKEEVLGHTPRLLKSGSTPTAIYASLWQTITAGEVWRGEFTICRKDGTDLESALTVSPIFDEHRGIEGFVATHRDITREKTLAARMERLANTDGLTGLFNRRHLMARMEQELARARRYSRPLCLMLVDLDHFKQINDRFGHLSGDEVLTGSAQVIREVSRASDLVSRYGGEEFAVVLPETAIEKAQPMAERLRRRLAARRYYLPDRRVVSVTCSVGVAQLGAEGGTDSLIAAADAALYRAKGAGRDRVVVAG